MNTNPGSRATRHIWFSLKLAGSILGASLLITLARHRGWLEPEQAMRAFNIGSASRWRYMARHTK